MKILYLLFAVCFLVLQGAPEFSEARNPSLFCNCRGCVCAYLKCPFSYRYVGTCGRGRLCCRRGFGLTV